MLVPDRAVAEIVGEGTCPRRAGAPAARSSPAPLTVGPARAVGQALHAHPSSGRLVLARRFLRRNAPPGARRGCAHVGLRCPRGDVLPARLGTHPRLRLSAPAQTAGRGRHVVTLGSPAHWRRGGSRRQPGRDRHPSSAAARAVRRRRFGGYHGIWPGTAAAPRPRRLAHPRVGGVDPHGQLPSAVVDLVADRTRAGMAGLVRDGDQLRRFAWATDSADAAPKGSITRLHWRDTYTAVC